MVIRCRVGTSLSLSAGQTQPQRTHVREHHWTVIRWSNPGVSTVVDVLRAPYSTNKMQLELKLFRNNSPSTKRDLTSLLSSESNVRMIFLRFELGSCDPLRAAPHQMFVSLSLAKLAIPPLSMLHDCIKFIMLWHNMHLCTTQHSTRDLYWLDEIALCDPQIYFWGTYNNSHILGTQYHL